MPITSTTQISPAYLLVRLILSARGSSSAWATRLIGAGAANALLNASSRFSASADTDGNVTVFRDDAQGNPVALRTLAASVFTGEKLVIRDALIAASAVRAD